MTELLTLPSSPGSPEGWPGPACARGIDYRGSNPECSPKAPGPILLFLGWFRDADRGQGVPVVPHLCPLAAEACGRVQGEIPAARGLEEAEQARVGVWAVGAPRAGHCPAPRGWGQSQGSGTDTHPTPFASLSGPWTRPGLSGQAPKNAQGVVGWGGRGEEKEPHSTLTHFPSCSTAQSPCSRLFCARGQSRSGETHKDTNRREPRTAGTQQQLHSGAKAS